MVLHLRSISNYHISDAWMTIGSFDGVHLGHQEIIHKITAGANEQGAPAVVVTFHPHPMVVLRDRNDAFYLTTPDERAKILGDLGVDVVFTHEFNKQVATVSAYEFIVKIKTHFGLRQLWVGQDFALGHNREGNVERLKEFGNKLGFSVNTVEPLKLGGQVVSSSLIRNYIRDGAIEKANLLLGRPYFLEGIVIQGDGRGKSIGIPTANLDTGNEKLVPCNGVYSCIAIFDDQRLPAATNIGYRPTFDGSRKRPWVETHILDYQGDLYGKNVNLIFLYHIRGEKKFNDVQELIHQINEDILKTRKTVAEYKFKESN
jgi:riboflavin kinase/FMN adenylyltransferase